MSSDPNPQRPYARVLHAVGGTTAALALTWTLTSCSGSQAAAPAFDTVSRGTVATGVTASGALVARTSEQLGFAQGGRLTSVKVKVGQQVEKGDVLARVDDKAAEHALEQAVANVDAQAAALGRASDDPSVSSAASSLTQARQVVERTRRQSAATQEADGSAIARAKRQRSVDQDAKDDAAHSVHALEGACEAATDAAGEVPAAAGNLAQQAVTLAQSGDLADAANLLGQLLALASSTASGATTAVCGQLGTAQSAVAAAKQRVTADDTAVVSAQQRKRVDCASGNLAVANAEQGVVSARSAYNAAVAARPHNLDQQQALVDAAQAQVEAAQKVLDDTILRAPRAGTVSAVNGAVGEFVGPSTGTSALAPGSRAAIPGASGAGAAAASGPASPTRPGGTQLIVLSGLDTLQVVLPFEESDAAQVQPGEEVDVQLDAVPDLQPHGRVVSVAPSATPISGVVSYYATVSLDDRDPRERDGQTARATVLTAKHENVLTVPNSAVRPQGGASTVVVYEPSGDQRTVSFEAGLVGPDRTEVQSGLTEGQRVVVPSHP